MKPTRTLSSYVLLVGVMGLSIVGGILAYQIYSAAVKSQTTTVQKELIKSIDGTINQKTIDNLSQRVTYSDSQMSQYIQVAPTIEVTPTVVATTAAVITPAPTATGSATTE